MNILNMFRWLLSEQQVEKPPAPPVAPPRIRIGPLTREVTVTVFGRPVVINAIGYVMEHPQVWADRNLIKCPVCNSVIGPEAPIRVFTPTDLKMAEVEGVLIHSKEPLLLVGCGYMDCAPVGSVMGTLLQNKRIVPFGAVV